MSMQGLGEAFCENHGLPRADWPLIGHRLRDASGSDEPGGEAWVAAQRMWLTLLAARLGSGCEVVQSRRFLLLVPSSSSGAWLPALAEDLQDRVDQCLGPRPGGLVLGKLALLVFPGTHLYLQHLLHYADGPRPGGSDGACIVEHGIAHIALPGLSMARLILPHELAHAHLSALSLPLWLNEGVAQTVSRRRLDLGNEFNWPTHVRLYWRTHGLERFWEAEAFDESRSHDELVFAYLFAELLVTEIRSHGEAEFRRFLETAHQHDCGDGASRSVYGMGLGRWCSRLLGKGDWAPPMGQYEPDDTAP